MLYYTPVDLLPRGKSWGISMELTADYQDRKQKQKEKNEKEECQGGPAVIWIWMPFKDL